MKTLRLLSTVCLLLTAVIGFTQTPEQQKMMEDIEKKGMEAQRQYDSVMNSPQVKMILQQAEAMEAQAKIDRDKHNAEKQKKISRNTSLVKAMPILIDNVKN